MEGLGAGHAVLHRAVGQELDERHEELSSVGNFRHERGLDGRPTSRQQRDLAFLAHDDHPRESVGQPLAMLEKVKAWSVTPRATSRAAVLIQKLVVLEFTSDAASFELFDKQCLRLKQVSGIDIQDEVKCGLATLHMQHDMILDYAREQAGDVLQGQRGGAGHRQSQRGCRRCGAHADRRSERQG